MSNYPQYFLTTPIAVNGDKTIPPATAQEAGTGRLSQEQGWGSVNAMPINEGGVPPKRDDFNGALYILSAYLVWIQQGGLFNYSPNYDYEVGNEVMYQGVKYRALQANGPSSALKTPGTDATVWKNMDANVPAGACLPFSNVTLGGSDGRRPIFWGKSQADEGWVLADGGSDGQGGNVPNLVGKFIKGGNGTNNGTTGGSDTVTLAEANVPPHTHTITIGEAGNHTHGPGTMDITGAFGGGGQGRNTVVEGAFYDTGRNQNVADDANTSAKVVGFQASRTWTGVTSTNGSHTHTATCSSTGGSGSSGTASFNTNPPFYTLAYFVKLPE